MPELTVVIVSWNNWDYVDGCLRSLEEAKPAESFRTVVVDNGSQDGTPALVRNSYPWVEVIANRSNLGFAAANNRAIRQNRCPFVLLLNADTLVLSGALDAMLAFMRARDQVWVTGPTVLNGDRSMQRTGVKFPTNWNLLAETLFLDRLFPQVHLFGQHRELYADPSVPRDVDYLQGSCLLIRSKAFEKVGVLDEDFFMYFEETDLCYRIKQAGGSIVTCPDARVVHFGGGEEGHFDESRLLAYHRSLLQFYRKHYSVGRQIGVRCILALRVAVRLVAWTLTVLVRPRLLRVASSSARGYIRTIPVLFRWKEEES